VKINSEGEDWEVLTKPGLKAGQTVHFDNCALAATCIESHQLTRLIKLNQTGPQLFASLYAIGQTPLPPYIHWHKEDDLKLRELYQTTYAKVEGSAAAPTAGLHFTPRVDEQLREKGVQIAEVTLHVGLGTFLPVKTTQIADHQMHSEWYEVSEDTAHLINFAKKEKRRVVAVGTTSARTLETVTYKQGLVKAASGETSIYIYPPYKFKTVDALITNFHTPKSTLLMMISAFVSEPNTVNSFSTFSDSLIGMAYQHALDHQYRFYSFGDAMLIE
jgi:S-adenosylmethionine:tRNA ribosyltransferase-isomerase